MSTDFKAGDKVLVTSAEHKDGYIFLHDSIAHHLPQEGRIVAGGFANDSLYVEFKDGLTQFVKTYMMEKIA